MRPLVGLRGRLAILVMLADSALLSLIFTALPPALPAIADFFGGGPDGALTAQMVMTMPSIGLMLGGVFSGWFVDRIGARTTLLAALALYAAMGAAGLFVDDPTTLLATRLVLGFAGVTVGTANGYLIGIFVDPAMRARILGYRNAFGGVVGVIGIYSAGPLVEYVGWRAAFAIYVVVAVAVFALAMTVIPATPPPKVEPATPMAAPRASLLTLLPLLPFYALVVPYSIVMMINGAQLSFLLLGDGVTSPTTQSWVIGLGGVFSATASMFYGAIRTNFGAKGTFSLMAACLGGGTLVIGLSHNIWLQGVGSAITGFGCGVLVPYFYSVVYERAPRDSLGRGIGFMFSAIFLGDFLNPMVLGGITALTGIHLMFCIVGAVVLATAAAPIFLRRLRS